jgi:transcriptional regulator with XRE-family HTH domain
MSFGKILKEKREEKGLSIKDISRYTKIKELYLLAFEEEDFEKMPQEPFSSGFLKNYISYLDIKNLSLYDDYLEKRSSIKNDLESISESNFNDKNIAQTNILAESLNYNEEIDKIKSEIKSQITTNFKKIIYYILFIIIALSFIFYFYYIDIFYKNILKKSTIMNNNIDHILTNINSQALITKNLKNIYILKIEAKNICWILVKKDGISIFKGLIKKNSINTWMSFEGFEIMIGDIDSVDLFLNDKKLNIVKDENKKVTRVFINEQSLNNIKEEEKNDNRQNSAS